MPEPRDSTETATPAQRALARTSGRFNRAALPSPRSFYEREIGKLTRPNSKGWSLGRCLFHQSKSGKSLAVNLRSGGYYCFGCGVHGGDVIAFVRWRDKCDFKTACQRLGVWDGDSRESAVVIQRLAMERSRREQERQCERQREQRERVAARNWLHQVEAIYREAFEGLCPDDEIAWAIAAMAFDEVRDAETEYLRACGLESGD